MKPYVFDYKAEIKDKTGFNARFWFSIARFVTWCKFGKVTFIGRENIPQEGGFIMAANHVSGFDPITVGSRAGRDMHFMCKIEHYDKWYLRIILPFFNGFPVNRGKSDKESVEYAIRVVKEGHILCIFPQGTRDMEYNKPVRGKSGVGLIAREAHSDVLPVSIHRPKGDKFRNKLIVRYGKPIKYEELGITDSGNSRELHNATAVIMSRIGDIWELDEK